MASNRQVEHFQFEKFFSFVVLTVQSNFLDQVPTNKMENSITDTNKRKTYKLLPEKCFLKSGGQTDYNLLGYCYLSFYMSNDNV